MKQTKRKEWRWPFGSPPGERRGSGPLLALSAPGAASWGGRDAATLIRDGYLRNAVAYRCVRMLAEAAASVPLITRHDAAAELLRRPSPGLPCSDFMEAAFSSLLLTGNLFIEAVAPEPDGAPVALAQLPHGAMRPLVDARGWIDGWGIRGRSGHERIVRRRDDGWLAILHVKLFHPQEDVFGLPPLAAARRAIDLHNASADWAKALIDNAAKPSGALVYGGGGRLPPDQFERLKEELVNGFSGAGNAGRPLLLEGGLDWKPLSFSPSEMDFLETRAAAAREIALAAGVPPMLLGLPGDNTYANYREANLAFWRLSVLPLVQKIASALSGWLDGAFDAEVTVSPDLDRVPALSAERELLWARLEAASFVSREEKRRLAGLDS